jgi:hypothetical protein
MQKVEGSSPFIRSLGSPCKPGGRERVDEPPLDGQVGVRHGGDAPDAVACAAGELAGRDRRAPDRSGSNRSASHSRSFIAHVPSSESVIPVTDETPSNVTAWPTDLSHRRSPNRHTDDEEHASHIDDGDAARRRAYA